MDERDQGQQKSSVDRVNEFIGRAQDAQRNLKRARRAARAGRVAGRVAVQAGRQAAVMAVQAATTVVEGLAGTAEAWGPIALIVIIVIFVITILSGIITVLTGSPSTTGTELTCESIEGTCEPGPTCSGADEVPDTTGATCNLDPTKPLCCLPKVTLGADCAAYSSDPVGGLKAVFNISARNGSASDYSTLFRAYCENAKSPSYKEKLTNGGTLYVYLNYSGLKPCSGFVPYDNTIRFGPWTCGAPYTSLKKLISHESGHIIGRRGMYKVFPYETLVRQDPTCYDRGFLISYSLRYGDPKNESFAEATAIYSNYMTYTFPIYEYSQPLKDFPTKCDNTYNWLKSNVFGGYEY